MSRIRRLGRRLWREIRLGGLSIVKGTVDFYQSENLTFAASIAYYSLLSLFPFLLLALAILGRVTVPYAESSAVLDFVFQYFPREFPFVREQLTNLQGSALSVGIAGALLLVWAAMGVFGALTSAINHAWGVDKQPTFLKHKVVSLTMLAGASVLLLAGLLLVSAINIAGASWFAPVMARVPGLEVLRGLFAEWATTLLFVSITALVYYFVPNAKVHFRDVWIGAFLAAFMWRAALAGFSYYLRDLTRLSSIHGSLGAVVAFLIYVYFSAVILLFGAQVSAAYARLRRHRPDAIPAAPSPRV
jgi:membrane protein